MLHIGWMIAPNLNAEIIKPKISPFHAHYVVTKSGLTIAKSKRSLTRLKDDVFIFESKTESIGVARLFSNAKVYERSEWRLNSTEGSVTPINYLYKNSTSEKKREVKLLFDWDKNIITNIINGSPWTMATTPDVKDKLLYQVQMMLDLSKQELGTELFYHVADGGKIKAYHLNIHPIESIRIDDKNYQTIRITRSHKDRTTTFWCAKELNFIPVRIVRAKKNGSPVTATLEKLEMH